MKKKILLTLVLGVTTIALTGCFTPQFIVEGRARNELIEAQARADAIVIEAEARLLAEQHNAEAELVRARGLAQKRCML